MPEPSHRKPELHYTKAGFYHCQQTSSYHLQNLWSARQTSLVVWIITVCCMAKCYIILSFWVAILFFPPFRQVCSGCVRKVSLNQIWCLVYTQPPSQVTPRFILQPWRKIEWEPRSGLVFILLFMYFLQHRGPLNNLSGSATSKSTYICSPCWEFLMSEDFVITV